MPGRTSAPGRRHPQIVPAQAQPINRISQQDTVSAQGLGNNGPVLEPRLLHSHSARRGRSETARVADARLRRLILHRTPTSQKHRLNRNKTQHCPGRSGTATPGMSRANSIRVHTSSDTPTHATPRGNRGRLAKEQNLLPIVDPPRSPRFARRSHPDDVHLQSIVRPYKLSPEYIDKAPLPVRRHADLAVRPSSSILKVRRTEARHRRSQHQARLTAFWSRLQRSEDDLGLHDGAHPRQPRAAPAGPTLPGSRPR